MTRLLFTDCETTGLDYANHEVWEVGVIVRDEEHDDVEHHWFLPVGDLKKADPFALNIGKFWERHPTALHYLGSAKDGWAGVTSHSTFAYDFWRLSKDAFLVGACIDFDAWRIDKLIRGYTRLFPMWNYHLVDIEALAAGALKMQPPWKSKDVYEALGYKRDEDAVHTALGDARNVRDVYDLVMLSE